MFDEYKNPNAIPRFIQTEEFSTVVSNLSQIIFCGASTNIHESCTDLSQVIIPNLSIEEQRLYVIENLRNQKISVITEGSVLVGGHTFRISSVLHDTGASRHTYISPELF